MRHILFLFILAFTILACSKGDTEDSTFANEDTAIAFDQTKWEMQEGKDYPYRAQMLDAIVYNDTIRSMHKEELLALLGTPDRINEGHLYYTISQTRFGFWPLHTRTMVIKLEENDAIAWIKIHE